MKIFFMGGSAERYLGRISLVHGFPGGDRAYGGAGMLLRWLR